MYRRIVPIIVLVFVFLAGYLVGTVWPRYVYMSGPRGVPLKVDKWTGEFWPLFQGGAPATQVTTRSTRRRPIPPNYSSRILKALSDHKGEDAATE